jgi:succinate-semialdehyde dehydrogenase
MEDWKSFVGGEWKPSKSGKDFEVRNPFDNSLLCKVTDCTAEDLKDAIDSASSAYTSWKKSTPKERSTLLRKIGDLMMRDQDRLAKVLTLENGKPFGEAKGEVGFGAAFFHWFAEEARRAYGDNIPSPTPGVSFITVQEPLGVAAMITPWNFPIGMPARKISAALAAGCSCVLKPAEDTPLSSLELIKLIEEAGAPTGLVNIVPCSRTSVKEVGDAMCADPRVAVISFTGSCEVGKYLYSQCSNTVKRVALELGGNAPFIIFDSADVDKAVAGLMASKFRNTGQTCVTANRVLIQTGIYDKIMEAVLPQIKAMKVGNGMEAGVEQGPLINEKQQARVQSIVEKSLESGAKLLLGGKILGNGFEPTVLADVTTSMACWAEEIFGPVLSVMRFSEEGEAIQIANDCDRGLAAYFYSKDSSQIHRVSSALEAGMVGANHVAISTPEAPFGGYKTSGIGKEGSKHGLAEYSNIKLVVQNYN